MKKDKNKLGQSARVKIGGKEYSSAKIKTEVSKNISSGGSKATTTSYKTETKANNNNKSEKIKTAQTVHTSERKPIQNVKRETSISTNPQTTIRKRKVNSGYHIKGASARVLTKTVNRTKQELNAQDDVESKSIGATITTGQTGFKILKGSIKTSSGLIKNTKLSIQVGKHALQFVHRVDNGVKGMSGIIKVGAMTVDNLIYYKFRNAKPMKNLNQAMNLTKMFIGNSKLSKKENIANRKFVVGYALRTSGAKIGRAGRTINNGISKASDSLLKTEDTGTQALGLSLKIAHYTPKVATAGIRGVKTGVKTGRYMVRTYKGAKKGILLAKQSGTQRLLKKYSRKWAKSIQGKVTKGFLKAGKSIVTASIRLLQSLGAKFALPLMIIILCLVLVTGIVAGVTTVVAGVFSPTLSDEDAGEIDETEWLTTNITTKRSDLVAEVKNTYNKNLITNGGKYHFVRFFNSFTNSETDLSDAQIEGSMYTVEEYLKFIQPIFHTLILSEYEMEANESERQEVLKDIWEVMSKVHTEQLPTEYCNMTKGADGSVKKVTDKDGEVHAKGDCPNRTGIKYHADNVKEPVCSCDSLYYECNGHKTLICKNTDAKHKHNDNCYSTVYHGLVQCDNSSKHKKCNGYCICKGHKILKLTIELKDFDDLMNKYFLDEINRLSTKMNPTEKEKQRLRELQDYYEICMEYMKILEEEYDIGGGGAGTPNVDEGPPQTKYQGGKLEWPVPSSTRVTSPFGYRTHPVTGEKSKMHNGIDIGAGTGSKVVSAEDGTVITAYFSKSAGNYVIIQHANGLQTHYMHNSRLLVSAGQKVKRGQVIALVGSTGLSTGPHLHFGVKQNGSWINPMDCFK